MICSGINAADARARAEHASRRRLLNAYLRESEERLCVTADGCARIRLSQSGHCLVVRLTYRSALGLHDYDDEVLLEWGTDEWQAVDHDDLVALLLDEVAMLTKRAGVGRVDVAGCIDRLAKQIESSVCASALYLTRDVDAEPLEHHHDVTRRAEQCLSYGHPFHPAPKTTQGFGDELHRYAPELGVSFALHWWALRPDVALERRIAPGRWVPQAVADRARSLLGPDRADHVLVPVHPWQVSYLSGRPQTKGLVDSGTLAPLGALGPEVYPTSSVRTVCDPRFGTTWKLPLHVRITNFVRNNPLPHLARATDASQLVSRHAAQWRDRHPEFGVLLETGYRTVDPAVAGPELASDLAVLYRQNPFVDGPAAPQVVAGLLAEREGDVPLLVHEVRRAAATTASPPSRKHVAGWLRRYLRISLLPLLDVFDLEGVSFEAHVQNSLLHTVDGWPASFWVRDMEGASVSRKRLREPHVLDRDSPLLYEDDEAWLRLRYHAVTNHLGHLIHVLARYHDIDEAELCRVTRELLADSGRESAHRLLECPTLPAKANLVSRYAERAENPWFINVPNPLHEVDR